MSHRLWLLIEWLGDNDMFSNYGVVNSDSLMGDVGDKTNFDIGKIIFVPNKHNKGAKRGKILRISESKRNVKELKSLLERQDNQMKHVLKLCINTLKDMKTTSMILDPQSNRADDTDSSSDNDDVLNNEQDLNFSKLTNKFTSNRSRLSVSRHQKQPGSAQTPFSSRRSLTSSTPFNQSSKLTFDQATQTEELLDLNVEKIEQLENMLKRLYQQVLSLIGEAKANELQPTFSVEYSETEISEKDQQQPEEATLREVSAVDVPANTSHANMSNANNTVANNFDANTTPLDVSEHKRNEAKKLCIRRASAQTTNTGLPNPDPVYQDADMVRLGRGTTKLPNSVLSTINWSSYTAATRQLLKAIFPRKVLATHSLTGKQSPAFTNKPPKKALDPNIVSDIVDIVSDICGVSKRTVRSCITTKCTDEAKLYRNRQLYKQNNKSRENQENATPSSPSSNEIITKKE